MSKYKRIVTKIMDEGLLVKALEELGIPYERGDDLHLYGYQGDRRQQTAQVVVRRQHIDPYANDLGFARTDNGYEAIISEYDQCGRGARMLGEIRQQYAFEGVKQQAELQGYTVSSTERAQDGTLRLQLRRY